MDTPSTQTERESAETPIVDVAHEIDREIAETLDALVAVHNEIASIRALLARRPSQEGSVSRAIDRLTHERGRLAERLGMLQLERRIGDGSFPVVAASPIVTYTRSNDDAPPMSQSAIHVEHAVDESATEAAGPRSSEDGIALFRARHMRPLEEAPSARRIRAVQAPPHTWQPVLRELLGELGDLPGLGDAVGPIDEIDLLDRVTSTTARTRWASLPQPILREWIALIAARGRAVLPLAHLTPTSRTHLNEILVRLPEYVAQVRPGHVHGLARHHAPETGTWHGDAVKRMEAMRGYLDLPAGGEEESPISQPPSLRRIVSAASADDRARPGPEWPHWSLARDKRAVLVGGEPRDAHRERLETEFTFSNLEWVSGDDQRRHQALADRIARHGVDLVLINQPLVDAKTAGPILDTCRAHDVAWAYIQGNGVGAITQGIETIATRARGA